MWYDLLDLRDTVAEYTFAIGEMIADGLRNSYKLPVFMVKLVFGTLVIIAWLISVAFTATRRQRPIHQIGIVLLASTMPYVIAGIIFLNRQFDQSPIFAIVLAALFIGGLALCVVPTRDEARVGWKKFRRQTKTWQATELAAALNLVSFIVFAFTQKHSLDAPSVTQIGVTNQLWFFTSMALIFIIPSLALAAESEKVRGLLPRFNCNNGSC